jgi:hypothetical protein
VTPDPEGAAEPTSAMAVRYLGPEDGGAYAASVTDAVLVRLEPNQVPWLGFRGRLPGGRLGLGEELRERGGDPRRVEPVGGPVLGSRAVVAELRFRDSEREQPVRPVA